NEAQEHAPPHHGSGPDHASWAGILRLSKSDPGNAKALSGGQGLSISATGAASASRRAAIPRFRGALGLESALAGHFAQHLAVAMCALPAKEADHILQLIQVDGQVAQDADGVCKRMAACDAWLGGIGGAESVVKAF